MYHPYCLLPRYNPASRHLHQMISAISRFRVQNGMEKEVERAFLDRPIVVDDKPGFLGMETFTDPEDPAVFYLVTRWTDAESYRAWYSSSTHKELQVLDRIADPLAPVHRPGEPPQNDLRQLQEQLQLLSSELAVSLRENARKGKAIAASSAQLQRTLEELQSSHWHLKKIQEVLPLCMSCGKVRSSADGWGEVVDYLKANALFLSSTYCPECAPLTSPLVRPDAGARRAAETAPRSSRR